MSAENGKMQVTYSEALTIKDLFMRAGAEAVLGTFIENDGFYDGKKCWKIAWTYNVCRQLQRL